MYVKSVGRYEFYGDMIPRLPVGGLGSPFQVLLLSGKVVLARCLATKLHIIFLFSGSVCQDGLQWLGHGSKSYLFVSEGFRLLCCGGHKWYCVLGEETTWVGSQAIMAKASREHLLQWFPASSLPCSGMRFSE